MKQERHEDVLALEELYIGLWEEFGRLYDRDMETSNTPSGRLGCLNIMMGLKESEIDVISDLGYGISRELNRIKSLELGDKRLYIDRILNDLVEMENKLIVYETSLKSRNTETVDIK